MIRLVALLWLLGAPLAALGQEFPEQPVLEGDVRIHDPSMIEVDGTFIAFATGFEGGVDRGAIRLKTSPDGLSWKDAGALGKGLPEWVRPTLGFLPRNIWAPSVSRRDNTYYLYYSVSVFGVNVSAIGLMTSKALDPANPSAGWEDQGMVVASTARDEFNAIDPFRVDTEDGRAWLAFDSYWQGIKMIELDPETGMRKSDGTEMLSLASRDGAGVEAPSILPHDGDFYLFVSFDQCCNGIDSTYRIMVGRADEIAGPYLDAAGKPMMEGGGTEVLASTGRYIGPGGQEAYATEDGPILLYHYYDGENLGVSKLQVSPLHWTEDGWPELGPLPE